MDQKLKLILGEFQGQLESLYGERLARLVLFGSQARGEAESGSDIDVLVVLEGSVNPGEEIARTGAITSALSLKYDVVISCTFMSADRYRTGQSPLLLNVRREGVPL
jgi:predicted nucleotidyltransferase